jgi:hypothetical protein
VRRVYTLLLLRCVLIYTPVPCCFAGLRAAYVAAPCLLCSVLSVLSVDTLLKSWCVLYVYQHVFCMCAPSGEGRVHTCLRHNMNFLSEACQREENKLQALEYRDIRLKPKLAKVCSEERAVYCKVRANFALQGAKAGCVMRLLVSGGGKGLDVAQVGLQRRARGVLQGACAGFMRLLWGVDACKCLLQDPGGKVLQRRARRVLCCFGLRGG